MGDALTVGGFLYGEKEAHRRVSEGFVDVAAEHLRVLVAHKDLPGGVHVADQSLGVRDVNRKIEEI
ncbi:hypothetical protein SDC9_72233 [bioreactor metagenome]|uniref:Uncharacterized protein n=1 Tax=bioreactor metagenome TaxID=1076179 RepID=A0A644YGX1_9ZZZZ